MFSTATVFIFAASVFAVATLLANAETTFQIVPPRPGKPNQCPLGRGRRTLPVGRTLQVNGQCAELECQKIGTKLHLYSYSCGSLQAPFGCRSEADDSKPFPYCCPIFIC